MPLQEIMMAKEEEDDLNAVPCFVTLVTLEIFFSNFISFFPMSEL